MENPQSCLNINKDEAVGRRKLKNKSRQRGFLEESVPEKARTHRDFTEHVCMGNFLHPFTAHSFIHLFNYHTFYSNMCWKISISTSK